MFDNHVHSSFSGDSEMPPQMACHTAYGIGLKGLAFTDHLDYDFPNFDVNFLIDFDDYSNTMDMIKDKYSGRLSVLKGIEVGLQPHVIEQTSQLVKKYNFDFVIGSVHVIEKKDPYIGEYYGDMSKVQAYERYLKEIYDMLSRFDDFDVMGHIDYIIRYGHYDDRSMVYAEHSDIIDSILKLLVQKGKGMEINTASYREKPGLSTPVYDNEILKRYLELGGEIITIGSDAHSTDYIGYLIRHFENILMSLGYRYVTHFEGRKPVFKRL